MEMSVKELFSYPEKIIYAHEILSSSKTNDNENYIRELYEKFDFCAIDTYVFSYDTNEALPYFHFLKGKIDALLKDENKILSLAKICFNQSQSSTIESYKRDIEQNLKFGSKKLQSYIEYFIQRDETISNLKDAIIVPEEKEVLSYEIINDLLETEFEEIDLFDRQNMSVVKENLLLFLNGDYNNITPPLNFITKYDQYGYYLIHTIQKHRPNNLSEIKNVTINGKIFDSSKCSIAVTKINEKLDNNIANSETKRVIYKIQKLITAHLAR